MITREILMHFKGRDVHLCHGFLVDFYQFPRPLMTVRSPSRANLRWMSLTSAHLIALFFHPTVSSTSGLTERQNKNIDAVSFLLFLFLFLSFNWKTQGAPSIPATNDKKSLLFLLFIYPPLFAGSIISLL